MSNEAMTPANQSERGFSLLEMIVSMTLVALMAVGLLLGGMVWLRRRR